MVNLFDLPSEFEEPYGLGPFHSLVVAWKVLYVGAGDVLCSLHVDPDLLECPDTGGRACFMRDQTASFQIRAGRARAPA